MIRCQVQVLLIFLAFILNCWSQQKDISEYSRLDFIPSGMTITPNGDYILSVHPFCKPRVVFAKTNRVVKLGRDGEISAYPTVELSNPETPSELKLDSVFGLQSTYNDMIWFLDSGRFGETIPKLVGWNTRKKQVHKVIHLPEPVTVSTSFVKDIAVDSNGKFAYISDPAGGSNAALIVVNLKTGHARRLLQSHDSVRPDPKAKLVVEHREASLKRPDGRTVTPLAGVSAIALDKDARYLYYGPMMGTDLFRIATEVLRRESTTVEQLDRAVEIYAKRPICEDISIDSKGNIYLADLTNYTIGVIRSSDRLFSPLVTDPRLSWPGGLCFGEEGKLNCYSSQLHRSRFYHPGKDLTQPPYFLLKIKPLAGGIVGQ